MKQVYLSTINSIERMHRQFLELIRNELERTGVRDINNVQALILYNIGGDELTVGELTLRGYYLGSNVSYNVKKMTENDYLLQERSPHDRRSVRVRLTDKGLALCRQLETMFERHSEQIEKNLDPDAWVQAKEVLRTVESVWLQKLGFGPRVSEFTRVETPSLS